ncbi:MAG: hypothetical protein J6M64_08490, partial [Oscillospiraceae bacterium]|nr:hypothetical protein [Oscillospiraceae bacterium]
FHSPSGNPPGQGIGQAFRDRGNGFVAWKQSRVIFRTTLLVEWVHTKRRLSKMEETRRYNKDYLIRKVKNGGEYVRFYS